MRRLAATTAVLALFAAICIINPAPGLAEGNDYRPDSQLCPASGGIVPGYGIGSITLNAALDVARQILGSPLLTRSGTVNGSTWTQLAYSWLTVAAQNNRIVQVTVLPQAASAYVTMFPGCQNAQQLGLLGTAATMLGQVYGTPDNTINANGAQYWLYNHRGIVFNLASAAGDPRSLVRSLSVFPAGRYCAIQTALSAIGVAAGPGCPGARLAR
jgi:hypothetical protein